MLNISNYVAKGEVCDRETITSEEWMLAKQAKLSPQITLDEPLKQVLLKECILNARKGDVLLMPGAMDVIGQLLRQLLPPQTYGHSCLVTKDFSEIVHSTASVERLTDQLDTSTQRLPDFDLKYMWPGTVRQNMYEAIHGEPFNDGKKDYTIAGVTQYHMAIAVATTNGEKIIITPPLVVKPPPQQDKTVRLTLHKVADLALQYGARPNEVSKAHYRLYGYTKANLSKAGRNLGWASDSLPTVCSSFIWHMANDVGVKLGTTKNGLANYNLANRAKAANWLHEYLKFEVAKAVPFIAKLLQIDEYVANQIVNAFANDSVADITTKWKNPGMGVAVSPNNILEWFSPDQGGCYGHFEPVQHRPQMVVLQKISRWTPFVGTTTIQGTVKRFIGGIYSPVANAMVRVFEGMSAFTDTNGDFEIENVPVGAYIIDAQATINHLKYADQQEKLLIANQTNKLFFSLNPPKDLDHRRVEIHMSYSASDSTATNPSLGTVDYASETIFFDSGITQQDFKPKRFVWGNKYSARLSIKLEKFVAAHGSNPFPTYPMRATVEVKLDWEENGIAQRATVQDVLDIADGDVEAMNLPFSWGSSVKGRVLIAFRNLYNEWNS